jgi:SAM-dependent methyltransferase
VVRRSEAELEERFRQRYRTSGTDAQIRFERAVLGSDFGANGWTTPSQADELARRLRLRPGDRLLDIGTGRGWPGLYLALTTGCDVVLTDQPLDGLRHGVERAARDGAADRCAAVAAPAQGLPFRPGSFDAVVHTDVLC